MQMKLVRSDEYDKKWIKLGYKTVVSITEIPEAEAMAFFDWDAIVKAPVFK